MPTARTCAHTCFLALYDADACSQLVLAVLARAHAALVLYDPYTCNHLVLAVLVYDHAALVLYDADACQQLVLAKLVLSAYSPGAVPAPSCRPAAV